MRDYFITEDFMLDLSQVKVSYVEQSPRFKDTFFTQYSFPFSFYMDKDLRITLGNYTSLNATDLKGKHQGYHIVEGHIHKGTLEILEVKGNQIQAQIDSGFEQLPNFDKKLSELPLEQKNKEQIVDIYTHANEVCTQKYPEVNYNFPRIIYTKNKETEAGWEQFNQFINDRRNQQFVVNETIPHVNRNIMHPMPYLLHVLKAGFQDAGFTLQGDILQDKDFEQRLIFYYNENYSTSQGKDILIKILSDEYISSDNTIFLYRKEITLSEVGRYDLQSQIKGDTKIWVNNILIYNGYHVNSLMDNLKITFDNSKINGRLRIEINYVTSNSGSGIICEGWVRKRAFVDNSNATFQIHNLNEINLQNSVPDMTFGELVTTIKNWKNYDLEIQGNQIFMNKISLQNNKVIDFTPFQVEAPTKTFSHKKSFHISFTDLDANQTPLDSVFIDEQGVKLNAPVKQETTKIKINAYCMPIETFRGVTTATIKKEDTAVLSLVHYDGLHQNDNWATNPAGLMLPEILTTWEKWYKMRISSSEIKWSFIAKKNDLRHINIRDTLWAYNQKLWIKEITKNAINQQMYHVEIVTEIVQ